jgi:hypothetical protein
MPDPKSVQQWMKETGQKPAELWREILGQLRQLSTDVWNGVRFFVTVNAVILGAALTVASQQPRGSLGVAVIIFLGVLGIVFTLCARGILTRQRDYYLEVLAQKVLFEEEVGLFDVTLSGAAVNLSVPWSIERKYLEELKSNPSQWRKNRRRAKGTITRYLFLIYDGMLVIYVLFLVAVALATCRGAFSPTHQEADKLNYPTNAQTQQPTPQIGGSTLNETTAAQNQANTTKKQNDADYEPWDSPTMLVQIGLLIVGIGYSIFAGLQWCTIRRQAATTDTNLKIVERAYVTLSHVSSPPNEVILNQMSGQFQVVTQIMNFGHTPATVIKACLVPLILPNGQPLPKLPDYKRPEGKRQDLNVFLVAEDKCFVPWDFPLDLAAVPGIESGAQKLWLYGFVDYIDQFGQPYCAGYARVYDPESKTLVFITQDGYNYDRPRKKGEGNDWEE